MTRTRYLTRDIGAALPEGAALSFVRYLPPDAALVRELHPDAAWQTDRHASMLLAQISDQLSWMLYSYSKAHGGKPRKPKPIPRPGVRDSTRRVGRDPIPIKDFNSWYYGGE